MGDIMSKDKEMIILLVEDDAKTCTQIDNAIANYDDLRLAATTNSSTQALELT